MDGREVILKMYHEDTSVQISIPQLNKLIKYYQDINAILKTCLPSLIIFFYLTLKYATVDFIIM